MQEPAGAGQQARCSPSPSPYYSELLASRGGPTRGRVTGVRGLAGPRWRRGGQDCEFVAGVSGLQPSASSPGLQPRCREKGEGGETLAGPGSHRRGTASP